MYMVIKKNIIRGFPISISLSSGLIRDNKTLKCGERVWTFSFYEYHTLAKYYQREKLISKISTYIFRLTPK